MSSGLPNLLEQIGIAPEDFHWRQLSACKDIEDTNLFFEKYEKDEAVQENVDLLCLTCPVTKECFQFGRATKSSGVFGGFYLENGEVKKTRNAHKSEETVRQLAKKVFDDE